MKKLTLLLVLPALLNLSAFGQTTFDNDGGTGNSNIFLDSNWTNNQPTTSGNPGTISGINGIINDEINGVPNTGTRTVTSFVTIDNATINESGTGEIRPQGEWTINNGGTINFTSAIRTSAVINLNTGGTITSQANFLHGRTGTPDMTINGGTLTSTSGGVTVLNGSHLYLLDGTINTSNLLVSGNGLFTISGGIVNASASIGSNQNGNNQSVRFEGGTTTADTINLRSTSGDFQFILGGTTAGSVNVTSGVSREDEGTIGWESGSLMSLTIGGEGADWAETFWNAGYMTHDGADQSTLGDWDTVNGTLFDYSGTTLTLIPEPSSIALVGIAFASLIAMRRRRG